MSRYLPIEKYVPHRGAMLLIERLLDAGPEHAVAQVRVPRDGLFMDAARVPAWVGIEYMAQTVAAWAGWQALANTEPVKVGFLLGSRKFEAFRPWFDAGCVLRVEAHCEFLGSDGLGMFSCRILESGELVARARISVFEPADGVALLKRAETVGETKT